MAGVAVGALVLGVHAAGPGSFIPDATFKGSALTGWHVVGNADWKAQNGELIGTAKAGGTGGWLVMDKGFQDVQLYTDFKCTGTCTSGVLLRAEKQPNGGLKGVYVSLTNGEIGSYLMTVDAQGNVLSRDRIVPPSRGGGAGAATGGGAAPAASGAGRAAAPAAATTNAPAAPAANAPAAAQAPARAGGGGTGGSGGRGAAAPSLKAGEYNPVNILISMTMLRVSPGGTSTLDEPNASAFGPIALHVAGSGEVRFKDLAWKDLNAITEPKDQTSPRYTAQRLTSLYYGWSVAGGDFNHDGNQDLAVGPFYFLGPSFTVHRIFRADRPYNPSVEYSPDMVNLAADFTGDGWPDILSSRMTGGRPMDLYVNPKGEPRRWDKFTVLPTISTEVVVLKDLDKDGKPEALFGGGGVYAWAHPDPANPTAAWTSHPISVQGQPTVPPHGIGVGDVNGDGRLDVVVPFGWFEQPAAGINASPWTFHAVEFGNNVTFGNGGGEYGVYDVNGDGLTDVVGGQAHNWGLNWFEQKKDGTFVQHQIAGDFAAQNMGGVAFTESHAARFVDMNGDGILDFVTGKRLWSHLENYGGEDAYGPAVVYIYKTVRDPKAPGGARFEPELVHNHSGVGSSFEVMDVNKDGVPDISTSGAFGAWVFLSKPANRPAPAPKK